MALCYNGNIMGTLTLVQNEKKYKIQIRQCNALATFLYVYKQENPQDPKYPWVHQLVMFFTDEQHIKNCIKGAKSFKDLFWGELKDIKLNLAYKESNILLKYFVKEFNVKCYYKEPKK